LQVTPVPSDDEGLSSTVWDERAYAIIP
jgi:hypothetical protein